MGSPGFDVPHRSWILRGLVFLVGVALVAVAAFAVFEVTPEDLNPEPGEQARVTETVDYWTPRSGDQQALRPRTATIEPQGDGFAFVEQIQGVHSPRGDRFALALSDRLELAEEPGAVAAFPPTPLWSEPPEIVYLAVPWETPEGVEVGAFDDFHRLREVPREGMTLVEYKAREPNQFFLTDGTVWFRSIDRTALVDPVSGTVVDYREHEILWKADAERPALLNRIDPPRTNREKVWEATVEPTPSSVQALAAQAEEQRDAMLEQALVSGGVPLAFAWVAMGAGLAGWPRRWLGPPS